MKSTKPSRKKLHLFQIYGAKAYLRMKKTGVQIHSPYSPNSIEDKYWTIGFRTFQNKDIQDMSK